MGPRRPGRHDRQCALRIRLQLAGAQPPDPLDPLTLRQVAEQIGICCGHRPLKAYRLAAGWTVEEAVRRVHAVCEERGLGRCGLVDRSWREWEATGAPDRFYLDLLCRLFSAGPVQLGFAADYSPPLPAVPLPAAPAPRHIGDGRTDDHHSPPHDLQDLVMAAAAVGWYEAAPPERRRIGEQCLAMLDLAAVRLARGDLDGTVEVTQEVLSVGARRRTDSVARRLQQLGAQLARPAHQDAPLALALREEIGLFCRTSAVPALEAEQ